MKQSALAWGIALVTGVVSVYLWQQLDAERQLTAQLRQQIVSPNGSLRLAAGQPLPAAGVPAGETPVAAKALQSPVGPEAVAATAAHPPAAANGNRSSPLYEEKIGSSLKLNKLQQLYPGLVKELRLTSAEAEALHDLVAKQQATLNASLPGDGNFNAEDLRLKISEMQKSQAAELEAQLGPGRSQQWREYQTTVEARRRVNELTMMLASSAAINEEQTRLLVASIAAEQKRRAQEESMRVPPTSDPRSQLDFEEQNLKGRVESNRRTVDAARSFMTPEQVTLMQDTMARANDRMRASLEARRSRLESGEKL